MWWTRNRSGFSGSQSRFGIRIQKIQSCKKRNFRSLSYVDTYIAFLIEKSELLGGPVHCCVRVMHCTFSTLLRENIACLLSKSALSKPWCPILSAFPFSLYFLLVKHWLYTIHPLLGVHGIAFTFSYSMNVSRSKFFDESCDSCRVRTAIFLQVDEDFRKCIWIRTK